MFHRVIAASGSALAPWALSRHPAKNAEIMGQVYNCSQINNLSVLRCLQEVKAEDLNIAQYNAILIERFLVRKLIYKFYFPV